MSDRVDKPSSEAIQQVLRWLLDPTRMRRGPVVAQGGAKTVDQ